MCLFYFSFVSALFCLCYDLICCTNFQTAIGVFVVAVVAFCLSSFTILQKKFTILHAFLFVLILELPVVVFAH